LVVVEEVVEGVVEGAVEEVEVWMKHLPNHLLCRRW
jgi:hypothetical protein